MWNNKNFLTLSFAVTADMIEPFLEGKTMEEAIEKKKLYYVDLTYMEGMEVTKGSKVGLDTAPICYIFLG